MTGVAAALRDGDTVDLLVSYDIVLPGNQPQGGVTRRQVTQLTMQDVEVLRVGAWSQPASADSATPPESSVVTFIVNPQDALVLKFLRETTAEVQFALRAAGDHQVFKTEPVISQRVSSVGWTITGPDRNSGSIQMSIFSSMRNLSKTSKEHSHRR